MPVAVVASPAERRDLTRVGIQEERGKLVVFLLGREVVRPTDETAGKGCWRKRMPSCNEVDRDSSFVPRESGQTSSRCLITRKYGKPS